MAIFSISQRMPLSGNGDQTTNLAESILHFVLIIQHFFFCVRFFGQAQDCKEAGGIRSLFAEGGLPQSEGALPAFKEYLSRRRGSLCGH